MVYICDNNGEYSDHQVYFVDTEGFDDDDAETIVRQRWKFDSCDGVERGEFVIAKVEKIEWYAGAPRPLASFYHWRMTLDDPKGVFGQLKLETVEKLYQYWLGRIDLRREELNKKYDNFPQPKRGQLLKAEANARLDEERKQLTEHMSKYLTWRKSQ